MNTNASSDPLAGLQSEGCPICGARFATNGNRRSAAMSDSADAVCEDCLRAAERAVRRALFRRV